MKNTPMWGTVWYGVAAAVVLIPLTLALDVIGPWYLAFRGAIVIVIGGYALFLTRLSKAGLTRVAFPMLVLAAAGLFAHSTMPWLVFSLTILSWIRSGVCYPGSFLRKAFLEGFLTLGGIGLVAFFNPTGLLSWSLAILAFFLIQSMYFIRPDQPETVEVKPDSFETARRRAEAILSGEGN
jgi:hypothetical protein